MTTPFIIGVAGGSGSGKTTVTRKVLETIGAEMAAVIVQDDYYRDQSHLSFEQRLATNYDHPHAFDWPLLIEHIDELRCGRAIEMPSYDFTNHTRASRTVTIQPAPVIVTRKSFGGNWLPLPGSSVRLIPALPELFAKHKPLNTGKRKIS